MKFNLSKAQASLEVEGYRSKVHSLCGYMGKIALNTRREPDKIVVISKTSSWKSDPQGSDLWDEAVREEVTSYEWNIVSFISPIDTCVRSAAATPDPSITRGTAGSEQCFTCSLE